VQYKNSIYSVTLPHVKIITLLFKTSESANSSLRQVVDIQKGKVKLKFHHITGHEGTQRE